jgi:hypothetical protein
MIKMMFTIEEIRNYILSQDSLGDVLYNLKEENIRKANEKNVDLESEETDFSDIDYWGL